VVFALGKGKKNTDWKKTPPLGRAYVTVMKEKEIWGRVEFLWDKVNGRLIFFDQVFFSRTDQ